jgi:D-xylono/L-arabinono-1,4-lactonase
MTTFPLPLGEGERLLAYHVAMDVTLEPLSNQHCNTGENPYWHPDDGCVYWTDIPAGVLYQYDPATKKTAIIYRGDPVGGFTLQADGKFLLFRVKDVATFDPKLGHVTPIIQMNWDANKIPRFNDVHADPLGRVFAGTMGKKKQGGLFLIERDGTFKQLFDGVDVSNGMAFTPDEKQMYWTDTGARTIYRFDYDRATAALTNRIDFYNCPEGEGWPDGMAMDEAGNLWSARWDGARICLIEPNGKKYDEIPFPVQAVSCCIFGGPENDELFVTTAKGKPGSDTADGTLYRIRTQTRGRPRFRSAVLL